MDRGREILLILYLFHIGLGKMLLHQYVTWVSAGIWEILWIPGSRMVRQDMTGEDDMYSTLQEHLVSKGVPVII
jgi:hypothetical protein